MSSFTNLRKQISRKKAQLKIFESQTPLPTSEINQLKDDIAELEQLLTSTPKKLYKKRTQPPTQEEQAKLDEDAKRKRDENKAQKFRQNKAFRRGLNALKLAVRMKPFDQQVAAVEEYIKTQKEEQNAITDEFMNKLNKVNQNKINKAKKLKQYLEEDKQQRVSDLTQKLDKVNKNKINKAKKLKQYLEEEQKVKHSAETEPRANETPIRDKVQSLLFDNKEFTPGKAKKWAKEHGFISPKIHETEKKIRLRQYEPEEGEKYRTLQLRPGVQGIVSVPKETPHFAPIIKPKTTTKQPDKHKRREPGPQPEPEEPKAPKKEPKKKKGKAIPQIDYPSSTLIVASKFSGKTNLILNIVDKNKFDNIFIITQTGHLGNLKRLCVSDECLLKDISDDFVKELLDIQKGTEMQTLLIFDDVVGMKLDTRKMRQLYTSGRNFGISIIMSIQDLMKVPTAFRRNLEYVFGGNMTMSNQEAFGKEYGQSTFPKKRILEVLGEIARDNAHDWLFHDFRHRTWKKILGADLKKFF